MTFRVGQKVVCIDDAPDAQRRWVFVRGVLKAGRTYTCAGPGSKTYHDVPTIVLEEVENDLRAFRASRFRPAIERSTQTGMAILKKIAANPTKKIREKV